MKSIQRARIVVVDGGAAGDAMVARLRRMDISQVMPVDGWDAARRLCQSSNADVCLVIRGGHNNNEFLRAENDAAAPGRDSGVPSLMVAGVVTPHLRAAARRAGFLAVLPAAIAPQLLYRRIGAALQRRSVSCLPIRPSPGGVKMMSVGAHLIAQPDWAKLTLH